MFSDLGRAKRALKRQVDITESYRRLMKDVIAHDGSQRLVNRVHFCLQMGLLATSEMRDIVSAIELDIERGAASAPFFPEDAEDIDFKLGEDINRFGTLAYPSWWSQLEIEVDDATS